MRSFIVCIYFIVFALAAASCSQGIRSGDYDLSQDCFNGVTIVGRDGKYGAVDSSGKEILPVAYDDLWFLTDDIAAAFSGSGCEFFDRRGVRLAWADDASGLSADELLARYEKQRRIAAAKWEKVTVAYEYLCTRVSEGAGLEEVKKLSEAVRAELRCAEGDAYMDETQRQRIENAYKRCMK